MRRADWPQHIVDLDAAAAQLGWSTSDRKRLWNAHELIAALFAGRMRGSGRPFLCHLAGTAGLALENGASVDEVLAGYAHAAYDQGEFGRSNVRTSPKNRAELRSVLGRRAEDLVHAYSRLDWDKRIAMGAEALLSDTDPMTRQVYTLRACNALDDLVDYLVYSRAVRAGFRTEIEVAAQVMDALAQTGLAKAMRDYVATCPPPEAELPETPRAKKSHTLRNRAHRTALGLSLRRDPRAVLRAVRHRLGL